MVSEVIQALQPRDGGRYLDGTVGGGGHAEAILEASSPSGFLVGSDRDSAAVEASTERLRNRGLLKPWETGWKREVVMVHCWILG